MIPKAIGLKENSGSPCLGWSFSSLLPAINKNTCILNGLMATINHKRNQHQDDAHALWCQDGHQTVTLTA